MRKTLLMMAFAIASLGAMAQSEYHLTLNTGDSTHNGMFKIYNAITEQVMDSMKVVEGKASISGAIAEPILAYVIGEEQKFQTMIILEPGNIVLDGPFATGTPINDDLANYTKKMEELDASQESDETKEKIAKEETLALYKRNNNSVLGLLLLNGLPGLVGAQEAINIINESGPVVKDNEMAKVLLESLALQAETAPGMMFKDFAVEYNGKTTKLSDYVGKGKYVLVDFWASWCGPCKAEIPVIAEVYAKYKGDKFEVVGVATWDKPEATLKAMQQLNVTWPQILNAQKIGSDAYGINGIPEIILFAPDGKIVARGLRDEALKKAVDEAMSK